jgi:serine/threonine protein kinase
MFLTKDGHLKLGDLNVSKIAKAGMLHTQTGTPYYASPEVWKDQPYDAKSDIWSLGCVLYEIVALHPPFRATDLSGLYKKVVAGVYPEIPKRYSSELSALVKALLQVKPALRPTCGTTTPAQSLDQILARPEIVSRMPESHVLASLDQVLAQGGILETIILPKNLHILSSRLPKANYQPLPSLKRFALLLIVVQEPLGAGPTAGRFAGTWCRHSAACRRGQQTRRAYSSLNRRGITTHHSRLHTLQRRPRDAAKQKASRCPSQTSYKCETWGGAGVASAAKNAKMEE